MPGLLLRKKLADLHVKAVASAMASSSQVGGEGAAGSGAPKPKGGAANFKLGGGRHGAGDETRAGRSVSELTGPSTEIEEGPGAIELEEVLDVPLDHLLRVGVEIVKPDSPPEAQLKAIMSANYDMKHQSIMSSRTVAEFVIAGICEFFKLRARAAAKLVMVRARSAARSRARDHQQRLGIESRMHRCPLLCRSSPTTWSRR